MKKIAAPVASSLARTTVDGRRQRSARTRQLIIEAYLALARDRSPATPTAAEIAERAGYSVRSVFERFPDIASLQVAAVDYVLAQMSALTPLPHLGQDRQARLKSQVEMRAGTCERWMLLWRSFAAKQGESPALEARMGSARKRTVERLERMYEPELATLSGLERRQTLIALEALTDVESWARMREYFGLGFEEACTVWVESIDRLLPHAGEAQCSLTTVEDCRNGRMDRTAGSNEAG